MGLITWIIFGALVGWVASKIAGTDEQQGWIMNIVLGVVGALVGGFLFGLVTGEGFEIGFNVGSFIVAVIGAIIVVYAVRLVRSRSA
jgi:uncharacterized membrane protein YeaQ/YmgE (transglycosylase-associated protein family)